MSYENPDIALHCAIGLSTEAGEILDAYKKSRFYGRSLNVQNVIEEAGDIMWYLALLADFYGHTLEDIMEANIQKLSKRYPNGFFQDVINRDVENELSHIKG